MKNQIWFLKTLSGRIGGFSLIKTKNFFREYLMIVVAEVDRDLIKGQRASSKVLKNSTKRKL